jgi:molybdate transport system substrate-binding protein
MNRRILLCACAGLLPLFAMSVHAAGSPPLKMLSTMAVQGAFDEIAPMIRNSGIGLNIEFSATVPITERLQKGETADLAVLTHSAVQTLVAEGRVLAQQDLMISEEGIAVADTAPTPVIRTVADFKAVLRAAPSIGVTARGVSGLRFRKMLQQYGLDDVLPKLVLVDEGFTGTRLVKGEVAMAVQQISELRASGAKNIVRLPDELQSPTTFTVAILKTSTHPDTAAAAVKIMASPAAAPAYKRSGVMPLVQ